MATVQAPLAPGRKVVRTVTAPTIMSPADRRLLMSRRVTPSASAQSSSSNNLNAGMLSPYEIISSPPSYSRREVQSKYSLRQQLRETMQCITPPNSAAPPRRHHRREVTRCWSRERVIRSEVIVSIRRPMSHSTQELESISFPGRIHPKQYSTAESLQTSPLMSLSPQRCSIFGSSRSLISQPPIAGKLIPIRVAENSSNSAAVSPDWQTHAKTYQQFSKEEMLESQTSPAEHTTAPQSVHSDEALVNRGKVNSWTPQVFDSYTRENEDISKNDEQQTVQTGEVIKRPTLNAYIQTADKSEPLSSSSLKETEGSSSSSIYTTASSSLSSEDSPVSSIDDEVQELMTESTQTELEQKPTWSGPADETTTNHTGAVTEFRVIVRRDNAGYGLRVCGYNPVSVHSIRQGGTAEKAGLRPGDQIIKVNGVQVETMSHDDVVARIREKPTVCFLIRRERESMLESLRNTTQDVVTTRSLTANEDPVLRGQSRRYQKRRSSKDSLSRNSGTAGAIKRRARVTVSAFEPLRKSSPTPMDSASDSGGPYTDEDQAPSPVDGQLTETSLSANEHDATSKTSADDLPPIPASGSGFLRHRPSFGRTDRHSKGRPASVGPEMLASTPKISMKDLPIPSSLIEESGITEEGNERPNSLTELKPSNNISMSGVTKMDVLDSVGIANKPTLPSGRVMGRNFDDDSDDDIHIGEELVNLSTQFERASAVLSSPAKCGVFVNYLFTQNRDPVPALFYLVNQYYQYIMRSSKELLKDQRRVNVEIFTSFLHEKSPLRVDIPTPVVAATVDMMNTAAGMSTFKMAADAALSIVQAQVTKLAQEIRHGMDTWKPPESINILVQRTREEELAIFELCLTGRLQSLYQQATAGSGDSSIFTFSDSPSAAANLSGITYGEQAAQALCLALVTAYRYFSTPGVGGISCSESMDTASVTGHSIRNTLFARSFENLSGSQLGVGIGNATGSIGGSLSSTGSNMWTKLPSFCTRFKQKSHSHLFGSRKLKYSQKNHSLQERAFEQVTECSICGHLLWGLAPQGLACNNCDLSVHSKCKSSIRDTCTKEGRRSTLLNVPTSVGSTNGFPPAVDSSPDRVKSHNLLSASLSPAVPINSSGVHSSWSTRKQRFRERLRLDDLFSSRRSTRNSFGHDGSGTQGETVGSAIAAFTEALSDTVASQARVPGENINISPSAWNQQSAGGAGVSENVSPTSAYESHTAGTENGASDSLPGDSESLKQNFSGGEDQNSPEGDPRLVNRMRNRFEPSEGGGTETTTVPTRSDSVVSTSSTITGIVSALDRSGEAGSTAADSVPELVTTDWSDDPEMMAGESFEAAVELRRQFPDYQMPPEGSKSEKYIRTLCLLEFHQKCQYMVRHLKQYDYLLLRRWPPEHQALARILCLDQIPELIQLFRSLVACIERTKTAQGYKEMAEAVLAWLTDNSCANLKTWSLHCQALSCSNMLDCVKTIVRDYVRRSPDILPLLQTRHNKFVLIDGLKHMRILYFNLPLIANNIVKDLQKKTKSYKDEAKVWQQIHARLVSLPQTIDDVCMPLVKRINSGQITSNLDRKDVLFRQNSATIAPFQDLLLNFPRVLFRYWVVANAEVAVDKLTVTSANKVNHDYIRERTDMLSIMLHDALLFLVKDSDRFVLRAFKATREHGGGYGPERIPSTPVISTVTPDRSTLSSASFSGSVQSTTTASTVNVTSVAASGIHSNGAATNSPTGPPSVAHSGLVSVVASVAGTSISDRASGSGSLKLAPVFPLNNMFTSCGEKFGRDHLLNIVFMDPTVLVRVLFSKEEQRQHWFNLLRQNSIVTGPRVASMHHQRSKRPISPIKPSSPRSPAAQPSGSVSPLQRVPSEPLSKLSSAEKEGYGNGSNPAVFPPPAPTPKAPPFSVSVDLTSSVEEIVSPADRLHRIINEYNRLNEQMRQAICETYHVSEEDMEKRSLNINAEGVRNIDDLLLLQVEFTREWLHSLSQTLYQTLHRRGTLVSSPFIADEDAAAAEKHRSSLSCSRICDSADLLDSAPKSALPCTAGASSDTLEKRQFTCSSPDLFEADSLTAQPVSRAGRGTVVTVQDHRRSKRRTKSELLETEDNNAADFDSLPIEQLQELLAKTTRAIQQCTKLVNRRSTVPLEHDRVATILAQQSSILNLDTASSNELLSSGESLKVSLSDELQRKDSGTLKPPSSQEVESSKKSDDIPKVASEEEGEQEGRHPRLAPIASGETRGSSDESLVLEDLEPGEHSLSYIIDDVARDLVNATIESALEVTDGGDPMALNVDPSPEKQQSLKSSNIRDSGCVPCVTDDEEGIAEEVETKEDNLETETTTGSPELDIELTPTMAPRSSDVLDELSEYVPPRDVEEIQLKDKGTSNIGPEEGGTDCPSIQFKEPDPVQTNLSSVSVGRADSQKSTTSSGFVESGDD